MSKQLKIPILPSDHQQRIVDYLDSALENNNDILNKMVNEFKEIDLFKFLLHEKYDDFDGIIGYVKMIIDYEKTGKRLYNIRRKWCFETVKCEMKLLGEVCEMQNGKIISKELVNKNTGIYPVIGGGIKPFGFYNKFNFKENTILISKSGANAGYVSRYNTKIWASDCFAILSNKKIIYEYIYNYLYTNISKFTKKKSEGGLQTGQAQPHVCINDFKPLKIPVPSLSDQEKVVKMIDDINKEESDYNKMLDGIKLRIKTVYDNIDMTINSHTTNKKQIEEDIVKKNKQKILEEKKLYEKTNTKYQKIIKYHTKII